MPTRSVREIQPPDIDLTANYWLNSGPAFLQSMGVALNKASSREQLTPLLSEQLGKSYYS